MLAILCYNSNNYNTVVFGPWSHGDWARTRERQVIGNIYFGDNISDYFQKEIETKFFNHFLKDVGNGKTGDDGEEADQRCSNKVSSTFQGWVADDVVQVAPLTAEHIRVRVLAEEVEHQVVVATCGEYVDWVFLVI